MITPRPFHFLTLARPVSLGSMEAMRLMGLTLLDPESRLTARQEACELMAFTWLHTAPLGDVLDAIWRGTWPPAVQSPPDECDHILALFRVDRARFLELLNEVTMTIRCKPRSPGYETPPADVVLPSLYTHRLCILQQATHQPREQLEWHMSIVTALEIYHHARWHEGAWTVKPGMQTKADDFVGFTMEAAAGVD